MEEASADHGVSESLDAPTAVGTRADEESAATSLSDAERIEQLERELTDARAKAESHLSDLKRVQADFINYRRRTEIDVADKLRFANSMLILRILPILDDLERAFDVVGPSLAGLQWVQGIELIARKLRSTLDTEGITKIEALGEVFDPRLHEAVLYEAAPAADQGKVIAVLQTGYRLHDRVIRPAMVKVGHESAEPDPARASAD